MTEAEWAVCADPMPMLEFLEGKASDRKLRLFACACCRRISHFVADERAEDAIEVAERMADGRATNAERRAAALAAGAITFGKGAAAACVVAVPAFHAAERSSANAALIFGFAASAELRKPSRTDNSAYFSAASRASEKERAAQTPLLREIFGNPFQPVTFDPHWFSAKVIMVAKGIYDEQAFERLPLLTNELIEAGYGNEETLEHCRSEGPHVRGCWVVDRLLGKE